MSRTLYHGARAENLTSIATQGLIGGSNGRLGPNGIYLTDSKEVAAIISAHRTVQHTEDKDEMGGSTPSSNNNIVIFTVQVDISGCVDLGTGNDGQGRWAASGKKIACGTHPAWLGLSAFKEYVVLEPGRCKITAVDIYNCSVGAINNPNLDIITHGNCCFNGPLVANTVTCS